MSDIGDKLERLIRRVTQTTRYYGLYRYRVANEKGATVRAARPDLVPVDATLGLATIPAVDKLFGVPGVAARLVPKSQVIIAFEGGNPGAPFVIAYAIADAQDLEIATLGKVHVVSPSVGPPLTPSAVVLMDGLATWASSVNTAVASIQTWIGLASPIIVGLVPSPPLTFAAAVVLAAKTALGNATTALSQPHPVGAASTKLEAV